MCEADPVKRGREERRLEAMGFRFIKRISCAGCGVECDWYWTPRGKILLLTCTDLKPHWKICKRAFGNPLPVKIKTGTVLEIPLLTINHGEDNAREEKALRFN